LTAVRCRGVWSLLVAVMLALSACGAGGDEPADPAPSPGGPTTTAAGAVVAVTVRGGQVLGPSRQRVERNERVTVRVTSDVADEIHVHGYNQTVPVAAGATAELSLVASIPGVFEVEFERSGKLLFTLEVRS